MEKRLYKISIFSGLFMALTSQAWATDAFNFVGTGPISQGMGGTGVAYNIGPGAMLMNPATLSAFETGRYASIGLDIVNADLKVENTATGETAYSHSHGRNNGPYIGPELSFVLRNDNYALGIGAYASDGVGTQFGSESFLSRTTTNGLDTHLDSFSRLLVLRIPVSFAYDVNEKLSVGGSLDAVWTAVNLGFLLDTSQIGKLAVQQNISGSLVPKVLSIPDLSAGYLDINNGKAIGGGVNGWGLGGRVGLTYKPVPETTVGIAYNFKTNVGDLSGDADLTAVSGLLGPIPLAGKAKLSNFEMPAALTIGVSQQINPATMIAFDYKHVFWSDVMGSIKVHFEQNNSKDNLDINLPLNYHDTNVYSLGIQYASNQKWTFRTGLHYAQLANSKEGILSIIPSTPTTNLTVGLSYFVTSRSVLDFSLAYGFKKKAFNNALPITDKPIEVSHAQLAGALTYTTKF
ncbi:OmpP1/FadL family transporter [Acinetobacter sp. ANC 5383]